MTKIDLRDLLSKEKREENQADQIDKRGIMRAVRRYPKDTPKEFEEEDWESIMDPL